MREDSAAYRPVEVVQLIGKAEKARRCLSWVPELGFRELVSMMVDGDLRMLREKIDTK